MNRAQDEFQSHKLFLIIHIAGITAVGRRLGMLSHRKIMFLMFCLSPENYYYLNILGEVRTQMGKFFFLFFREVCAISDTFHYI